MRRVNTFLADQRGGTAIEYGLIGALIILAMMGAVNGFANHAISMLTNVAAAVAANTPS